MKPINVITSSEIKMKEFKAVLLPEFNVVPYDMELIEPQLADQYAVTAYKAKEAYSKIQQPLCVDDFGLYIPRYNNFPGTLTGLVFKTLGYDGFFKLIDDKEPAYYKSVIAYIDENGIQFFDGILKGHINCQILGEASMFKYPCNNIFIPEGSNKPYAEVYLSGDGFRSHRRPALEKLKKFLLQLSTTNAFNS
ncbi:nucleoside-triphosphatase [Candidatus Vecturithrix granuli]|uniref:Nucleoside-triphosphatase n=1 Tax=Vecturithrix granuli TaxID=1499967 RepID=A0A081C3Z0_VECG1|nr:nucleoside-triphosphatase [Candidatus Vecturithrix granuli]